MCFLEILLICTLGGTLIPWSNGHGINKRFLIFPQSAPTRHQFIAGIGIPADLNYESLTVGYVFKAQFFLPYNETTFRRNPLLPEYEIHNIERRKLNLRAIESRWNIYSAVEEILERNGYNGEGCLLRTICEWQQFAFDAHYNILSELVETFLTPSTSLNTMDDQYKKYLDAEAFGRNKSDGGTCETFLCNTSLLQHISKVVNFF